MYFWMVIKLIDRVFIEYLVHLTFTKYDDVNIRLLLFRHIYVIDLAEGLALGLIC